MEVRGAGADRGDARHPHHRGVYALVGREVTTSTVAALLTILGYSLYDTIIVFDRCARTCRACHAPTFSQIVNRSMSEVLTRSLATSFCTRLPVLALLLFGGETLKDFAFALLVGTISGAYSSCSSPGRCSTHWKEREPVYRARRRRIHDALGARAGLRDRERAASRSTSSPSAAAPPPSVDDRPDDPAAGVSRAGVRGHGAQTSASTAAGAHGRHAARPTRPAGARRARSRGNVGRRRTRGRDEVAKATPATARKRKEPRKRPHGRPR